MDVNGTKYHLLFGQQDWGNCLLAGSENTLSELWSANQHPSLEWDETSATLRLAQEVPIFRRSKRMPPLDLNTRRGAGRDRYGNWYWIDQPESGIRCLPNGSYTSQQFWTAADREQGCIPSDSTTFTTCLQPPPPTLLMRGLAVTTRHYLVVGDVTEHGLLLFDLHRGGTPLLLRWPDDVPFTPWDLAATPNGGVLVLDSEHSVYWVLDSDFRLMAEVDDTQEDVFQPENSLAGYRRHARIHPQGYQLTTGTGSAPQPSTLISIEPGPDGHVLILDTDPLRPYSIVLEYQGANLVASYSLEHAVEAMDPDLGEGVSTLFSVIGHDFAYLEIPGAASTTENGSAQIVQSGNNCGCQNIQNTNVDSATTQAQQTTRLLYVAEQDGQQVMSFEMDCAAMRLVDQRNFLPLRCWDGKAIVSVAGKAYYDFADRWVTVEVYTECHYAGSGVMVTSPTFDSGVVGEPFDSDLAGCAWHRLFLDAYIPPETAIQIRARASDDPDLLTKMPWIAQPTPYRRSGGAEIPFYDPWARDSWATDSAVSARTGTWELLFQDIQGRYLQLELTIAGTGRSTPYLRALRAWYPRFSYLDHYLPAIYREDPAPAAFLERWLANFEGFYTDLEDKIDHVAALFDPRTTPAETLDWLACWFGAMLDPHWDEAHRRFFIRHIDKIYRTRGTVPGIEIAVRMYTESQIGDWLFDPRCLGTGKVRIVEQFETRGAGAYAYGPPDDKGVRPLHLLTPTDVQANAHRFTVMVPYELTDDQIAVVETIVTGASPAHTSFEIQRYYALFRVGIARLGQDTQLGYGEQFSAMLLGSSYLPGSYLEAPYPFNIPDRLVLDRNRIGDLPAL